jgi:hypothetical protein
VDLPDGTSRRVFEFVDISTLYDVNRETRQVSIARMAKAAKVIYRAMSNYWQLFRFYSNLHMKLFQDGEAMRSLPKYMFKRYFSPSS